MITLEENARFICLYSQWRMRHDVAALAINNNKKQRRRGGFETHKDGSGCEGGNYKMPVVGMPKL